MVTIEQYYDCAVNPVNIIYCVLSFFATQTNLKANHVLSDRVFYQWLDGTTYMVTIEKYYDCAVNPVNIIYSCVTDSTSLSVNPSDQMFIDTAITFTTTC